MNNESIMHKEIMQIPASLKLTKERNFQKIIEFCNVFREKDIKNIVIVARGSSDNVGVYFKYLCEIYLHIPVSLAASSVITKYDSYLNLENTLVIGISQSGSGKDIEEYLLMSKKYGALTLAITNNLNSIVAKASDYNLFLNLPEEKGLAATKTFISQMYLALLLVAEISKNDGLLNLESDLYSKIDETINNEKRIIEVARKCINFNDCYLLSRGINYVSSLEGALKIQETTYIKAKGYAISDFYHGPLAIVDEKQNIFLLCGKGCVSDDNLAIYKRLKELNANLIIIGNEEFYNKEENLIKIPACNEIISPFLIIITIQLLACNLSLLKGIDVDRPRNIKKVTVTR